MKIEIPLRPRRHEFVAAATAIYVPSRDLNLLFAQCARLGLDPTGRLFDVTGGFLARVTGAVNRPGPRCGALRAALRNRCICRSTPSWSLVFWTTRPVGWFAIGAWCFCRGAALCSMIVTLRSS